jgi:hypothetical protein
MYVTSEAFASCLQKVCRQSLPSLLLLAATQENAEQGFVIGLADCVDGKSVLIVAQ